MQIEQRESLQRLGKTFGATLDVVTTNFGSYFIDVLLPPIRTEVRRVDAITLKDALQAAQREEDILQAEASASASIPAFLSPQQRVASIQEPISQSKIGVDEKISRFERKLEENMKVVQDLVDTLKRKERKCYNCGKTGHIRRNCR